MSLSAETEPQRGFKAPGTTTMVAGGLAGAVGAYIFQAVGGRALGDAGFAPIAAMWTAFFILGSVLLVPLEQYVTREVSRGREALRTDRAVLVVVAAIGVAAGMTFVWVTLDVLFEGRPIFIAQMALLVAGYAVLFTSKGVLAGHRRFADIGWLLAIEGVIRVVSALAILVVAQRASALAWSMVAAPLAALLLRFWRHDRATSEARPVGARRFLGGYIGGSAASQLLLAGAPLGVVALGGELALFSVVFVTFTLFRAPLTLIYSLQARILPHLVKLAGDEDEEGLRRIAGRLMAAGAGLVLLGALVGHWAGPEVVGLLFSAQFAPTAAVAMLVAAGMVAASTAQVTGQILVAAARTGSLAGAWVIGLLAALLVMAVVPGSPDLRVATGFAAGETVALMGIGVLLVRARPPTAPHS